MTCKKSLEINVTDVCSGTPSKLEDMQWAPIAPTPPFPNGVFDIAGEPSGVVAGTYNVTQSGSGTVTYEASAPICNPSATPYNLTVTIAYNWAQTGLGAGVAVSVWLDNVLNIVSWTGGGVVGSGSGTFIGTLSVTQGVHTLFASSGAAHSGAGNSHVDGTITFSKP